MDVRRITFIRSLLRWYCERKGHTFLTRREEVYGRVFEFKECKRCRFTIIPSDFYSWFLTGYYKENTPKLKAALTAENPLFAALKEREPIRTLDGGATITEEIGAWKK